jgi:DNA-directed RNA polymerase subunit alpha
MIPARPRRLKATDSWSARQSPANFFAKIFSLRSFRWFAKAFDLIYYGGCVATTRLRPTPIQDDFHEAQLSTRAGREPMTRIPLSMVEEEKQSLKERLEMSTAEIGLTVRTTNCLEERGIFTVEDLLQCTRDDLLDISNFGEKTLEEVYRALESIGFYRKRRQAVAS